MTSKNKGFTLIELVLAMAFISFILLFIVGAVLQATRLYVKGMAIRQMNQTGRQVMETFAKSTRYAKPIYVPANQRLCVGGTSYLWNTSTVANNRFSGSDAGTAFSLVSVQDQSAAYCADVTTSVPKNNAVELAGSSASVLAFNVSQTGKLWRFRLVLSTSGDNEASWDGTKASCDPQNQFCAFGDFTTTIYSREE